MGQNTEIPKSLRSTIRLDNNQVFHERPEMSKILEGTTQRQDWTKVLTVLAKMNQNKEMLKKKIEQQERQFYWLPDLSLAGFATKKQIKKNVEIWHSLVRSINITMLHFRME